MKTVEAKLAYFVNLFPVLQAALKDLLITGLADNRCPAMPSKHRA